MKATIQKNKKGITIIHGPLNENDKHWGKRSKMNLLKKLSKGEKNDSL